MYGTLKFYNCYNHVCMHIHKLVYALILDGMNGTSTHTNVYKWAHMYVCIHRYKWGEWMSLMNIDAWLRFIERLK